MSSERVGTDSQRGQDPGGWLKQYWALVAFGLFALFIVGLFFFYRPPMAEGVPGDTSHAIRGLIGYPHGPGAAEAPVDAEAFDRFVEETTAETYAKARWDQVKFLFIAVLIGLVPPDLLPRPAGTLEALEPEAQKALGRLHLRHGLGPAAGGGDHPHRNDSSASSTAPRPGASMRAWWGS